MPKLQIQLSICGYEHGLQDKSGFLQNLGIFFHPASCHLSRFTVLKEMKKSGKSIRGFQKIKVAGVFLASDEEEGQEFSPIVFLENDEGKVLPIYIGTSEAFSIQTALEKVEYPRPLTHDLLISILEGFESKILKILIDDLDDGIFFARIVISQNGNELEFDARPSDSIALAVRTNTDVFVSEKIMMNSAVEKDMYKMGKE